MQVHRSHGDQSAIMAGFGASWNFLLVVSLLLVRATTADDGYFSGGTMSFYFVDTSNKDTYRVG